MSLKRFHLVFIAASITMFGFVAHWARTQGALGAGVVSAAGLAASTTYLVWFLRRYRALV